MTVKELLKPPASARIIAENKIRKVGLLIRIKFLSGYTLAIDGDERRAT